MKIKSFKLIEESWPNWKTIDFNGDNYILHSASNSTGKTTLMRAILYSLGFNIPNTELVKFEKYEFEINLSRDKEYKINRKRSIIKINDIEYDLPTDQTIVLSNIFGTTNQEIISNLLGTFYFDQEKGWTLLNRGTIIGTNRFNIESFFRGLKNDETETSYEIVAKISSLEKKIAQYNLMIDVAEYQDTIKQNGSESLNYQSYNDELDIKLGNLKLELFNIENEIAKIKEIIKENKKFSDYIEKKNIYINNPQDDNSPIKVTKETLYKYNDSIDFDKAREEMFIIKRNNLKKEIAKIKSQQEKQISLINEPTIDQEIVYKLSRIEGISSIQFTKLKEEMKNEKQKLSKILIDRTKMNNPWIDKAYAMINKYAEELSLPTSYNIDIFTRNLKAKSGAILKKMVFIYKLTYISLLSNYLNYPLPIFCDSPHDGEIEKNTVESMLRILKRDFSKHQIIIASIYEFKEIIPNFKIFELNGNFFDKQTIF